MFSMSLKSFSVLHRILFYEQAIIHLTKFQLRDMEVSNFPVKCNCNEHPLIKILCVSVWLFLQKKQQQIEIFCLDLYT